MTDLLLGDVTLRIKAEERAEKYKTDCIKAEERSKGLEDRVHELSHLCTTLKRELEFARQGTPA